jgi:hypothetical protein
MVYRRQPLNRSNYLLANLTQEAFCGAGFPACREIPQLMGAAHFSVRRELKCRSFRTPNGSPPGEI